MAEENVLVAFAELALPADQRAFVGGLVTAMPMWVVWMPEHGLLRFSVNLDLSTRSDDEESLGVLLDAAHTLNSCVWDRIAKVFVNRDKENGAIVGTAVFTVFVPPVCMTSAEGMHSLRLFVGANMARLFREAAVISVDLHSALCHAGIVPDDMRSVQKFN